MSVERLRSVEVGRVELKSLQRNRTGERPGESWGSEVAGRRGCKPKCCIAYHIISVSTIIIINIIVQAETAELSCEACIEVGKS